MKKSQGHPKKRKRAKTVKKTTETKDGLNFSRAGMPARDSVIGVTEIKKGKRRYRIIHTNEVDEYEQNPAEIKKR
jgi:hypothetical protein